MLLLLPILAFGADPSPPTHGVLFSVDAYGKLLAGHIVADTKALEAVGVTLSIGDAKQAGVVPLAPGMRVLGLEGGERIVEGAVDSLLYFDKNKDTYLDAADPAFPALMLFVDANADQKLQPGEARRLGDIGVESISRFGSVRMKER